MSEYENLPEYEKLKAWHQPNYIKKLKGNDLGDCRSTLVVSPPGSNKTKSTNRQKPKLRK